MQIVRTVLWVLLAVVLVVFAINNWQAIEVRVWSDLVLETKVAALAITSFLLGLVPMWLIHQATTWRLRRRIAVLEAAATPSAAVPAAPFGRAEPAREAATPT
jgi:uncharacterized membrane protein